MQLFQFNSITRSFLLSIFVFSALASCQNSRIGAANVDAFQKQTGRFFRENVSKARGYAQRIGGVLSRSGAQVKGLDYLSGNFNTSSGLFGGIALLSSLALFSTFRSRSRRRKLKQTVKTSARAKPKKAVSNLSNRIPIRVRFAPSPTGTLHVGGARTALYNFCFAKANGGVLVMRVDDTDRARSTKISEEKVLGDLKWLGIEWQEGVGAGGSFGPYRQSERASAGIYDRVLETLKEKGHVYKCFCTAEELDAMKADSLRRGIPPIYRGKWASASEAEIAVEERKGTKFVWRFRVPVGRRIVLEDLLRGRVSWRVGAAIGDFVVVRSDNQPVYNFATAVDDHLMEISHVVRAEEHLANTLKQLLIFDALNWKPPFFAHVPLVLAPDRTKLSKRHGATSVGDFARAGILPEVLFGYLLRAGDGKTFETIDNMIDGFALEKVGRKAAVFDEARLVALNRRFLVEMDDVQFQALIANELGCDQQNNFVKSVSFIAKGRISKIPEVKKLVKSLFEYRLDDYSACPESIQEKDISTTARRLCSTDLRKIFGDLKKIFPTKNERRILRYLLTGKFSGPELDQILHFLSAVDNSPKDFVEKISIEVGADFVPLRSRLLSVASYL